MTDNEKNITAVTGTATAKVTANAAANAAAKATANAAAKATADDTAIRDNAVEDNLDAEGALDADSTGICRLAKVAGDSDPAGGAETAGDTDTAGSSSVKDVHRKKEKGRKALLDLCYIAIFAAIITVCSYLSIPVGDIPVTLQTLAICLAAGLLGWKRGTLCVLVYILLGICGIPVFADFKNFYALLASPSAGYVIGFIFTALLVGFATDNLKRLGTRTGEKIKNKGALWVIQFCVLLLSMAVGIAICYFFGTCWYMLVYKGSATTENLQFALTWCVYPYILPDLVKIILAAILTDRLKRFVK